MFKTPVRLNSTAKLVQAQLAANLEEYFQKTAFNLAKPQHEAELRRIMDLVYLRKRPLVAVDIEAYERRPKIITELGFAIYDPENQWLSPVPHIRTTHIISHENKRFLNSMFVPNHKYRFNGGTSYQMYQKMSSLYLEDTFKYYFQERGAVIVGHNLAGDIKWLQGHGVGNPADTPQVDTQKLFHLSRKRGATLRGILQTVEIPHANLHNAANDAYYTLLAAMSYCDPQVRQNFGLDTYIDNSQRTDKELKEAKKKKKFCEKAYVSVHDPPSATYTYPRSEGGVPEAWVPTPRF
ncbi:hypothetical protein JCM33374_g5214 [Metschnikowia sp. JCM 33374]|nr:hypothetical protein JCM33374_g5214 [Metschnikowia sp. JCM 33374]